MRFARPFDNGAGLDYNRTMQQSPSPPRSSGRSPRPRRGWRTLLTTWRGRIGILSLLALLGVWSFWFHEHHPVTWKQLFNPSYWYHRFRGDDLYDPDTALIMHGNRSLHEVALTFDDGPHRQSCGQILDTLKRYGVHATFFDVGKRMAQNPDLLLRTLAEGHEIGNHTFTHPRLNKINERRRHREINDTDIEFYRITGRHLKLLRPPGMDYNPEILAMTKRLGYIVVGYNTGSHDFDFSVTPEYIIRRTLNRVENGSIILLHDYPKPALALPHIIEALQAQGYRFVTISEMIAHLPDRQRIAAEQFLLEHADTDRLARQTTEHTARASSPN